MYLSCSWHKDSSNKKLLRKGLAPLRSSREYLWCASARRLSFIHHLRFQHIVLAVLQLHHVHAFGQIAHRQIGAL